MCNSNNVMCNVQQSTSFTFYVYTFSHVVIHLSLCLSNCGHHLCRRGYRSVKTAVWTLHLSGILNLSRWYTQLNSNWTSGKTVHIVKFWSLINEKKYQLLSYKIVKKYTNIAMLICIWTCLSHFYFYFRICLRKERI